MTIVASNSVTVSNVNDGTITHTAWSYSADGTDGFTTVYPNLNLLEDGKFAKPIISNWYTDRTSISKDNTTGYFKVQFNGGSFNRVYYSGGISTIPIGQKYSVYIKAYSLESSLNIKMGSVNTSQAVTVTNNSNVPKTYKVEGLVRGTSDTFGIFGGLTTTLGTLFISEIKVEPGSTATPWMSSSSEVKPTDYPSYRGEYSDFSSTSSTDPQKYSWGLIRENSPYTYTAYANSADGTDGFTTVYPNLNLLTGTTFENYTPKIKQYLSMVIKNGGVNNEPYVSISYNNPTANSYTDTISWSFDKEYFKPSTTYTFSFYLKGNGRIRTHVYPALIDDSSANALADGEVIRPNSNGDYDWNLTSEWVRHTYTFITRSSIISKNDFLFRLYTGNSVDICLPKVEEGSIATHWTPTPSEDPLGAIPKYVGTAALPYDSYSKYEWKINVDWINQFNINQQSEIINAQNAADRANASISDMSKDSILTPIEKRKLLVDWTAIQSEYSKLIANANKFGVSTTAYASAYSVLSGYILSLISNLTVNSTIVANTFKTNFKNYYDAKVDLMNNTNLAIQANMDALGTNTAYSYSIDGTDRFTTVYPNLNLLEDGKFAKPISHKWNIDGTTISKDDITGYFKVKFNGGGSLNRTYYFASMSTIPIGQKYSVYIKAYSLESSLNIKMGSVNTSQAVTVTNNSNVPKTYKVEGLVRGTSDTFGIFGGLTTTLGTLFISEIKVEPGSTATPWMPSEKELTSDDIPKYVGYSVRQSENPKDFSWQPYGGLNSYNITKATTAIDQNSKEIALKANKLEVDTLSGRVLATESSLQIQDGKITALNTKTDGHTTQIGTLESSYNGLTSTISEIQTDVGGKADKTELSQLSQDLSGFKTTVANTYADKVSVASQITQSATAVTSNVQSWTNNKLTAYSTTLQTDSSITNAVASKADKSQITQLSDSINLKVSKGDVVSQINVEAGQILFNSNKLVLNANTTEINGNAFIRGDMIVDGSINAKKIVTNNLSAISSSLGDVKAGTYTSWSSETVNGILYLNGIYLYNGRIRSLNIQAPSSIDPDIKNQISGKNCRGTEVYSGDTHLFDSVIPQLSTASPNDILKGDEFWDKTSTSTYCGKISGYRTNGTPHTKYSSQHHIFDGTLQAKSMNGNVGGIVLSQGSFPVNVTPNNALKIVWGNEFSSLKLYGQVVGRRQFTLEINMDYVQELPNPDIGYRPYTASAIIGSLGEGVNNREWMVVAGINAPRNDLLFRTYYRDGNGNWNENSSTSSYIYLIRPMIY